MSSNSSRFRCLLRKAAARFLTRRASRLLKPETSGGTKSFVLTHVRVRFDGDGLAEEEGRFWLVAGVADVFDAEDVETCESENASEDVGDEGGGVGSDSAC